MAKLVVIADDLTGANDTGVQFRKAGLSTNVLLEPKTNCFPEETDIVVIDTDSRSDSSETAERKVRQACRIFPQQGIQNLYKKIDSTLRGNIGTEIFAAYTEFAPVITVIAPAYPKNRRSTIGGYQLLDGLPVSMTEIAYDPKTPVTEAWIPKLLAEKIDHEVGLIPLHVVMEGVSSVTVKIAEYLSQGIDWVIFDAVSDDNLRTIVKACANYEKVLWVGSAGLAEQMPGILNWGGNQKIKEDAFHCCSVLVIAGSVSKVTSHQVQLYTEKNEVGYIILDSAAAVLNPEEECRRLVELALPLVGKKEILLACSNERSALDLAIEAGKTAGLSAAQVSERIAFVLGNAVKELVPQGIDGVFLTGGETAVYCCRALQASGVEVEAEVIPGIPIGRLFGGPFHGLPIVTKAGAFGEIYAIVNGVKALKGEKYYESLSGLKL